MMRPRQPGTFDSVSCIEALKAEGYVVGIWRVVDGEIKASISRGDKSRLIKLSELSDLATGNISLGDPSPHLKPKVKKETEVRTAKTKVREESHS